MQDVLILLVVAGLASLYAISVYVWLSLRAHGRSLEQFGMSTIAGTLLLAVLNTLISAAIGSLSAAVAVLLLPLLSLVFFLRYALHQPGLLPALGPLVAAVGRRALLCSIAILAIGYQLFRLESLSSRGILHPDLFWHVGHVVEQAFLSSPGFLPLSPIAFPAQLPYQSFVVDSLIAATFRYLPFSLHAFTFCQVGFAWGLVLWTAVVLIAGADIVSSVLALTAAVLLAPIALFGVGSFGSFVTTGLHSNLNSLVAWQIGLALTFHLSRAYRRGESPAPWFVFAVPPASIFFKVNEAFAFAFLGAIGLILVARSDQSIRLRLKRALAVAALWALAFAVAIALGRWPVSAVVHGSMDNFWHYVGAAFPQLINRSASGVVALATSSLALVAIPGTLAVGMRARRDRTTGRRTRMFHTDVVWPTALLAAAMAFLFAGWWAVVPIGVSEGEPMHVNVMLLLWLMTVPLATALCHVHEAASRAARVLIVGLCLALWAFFAWRLNTRPASAGGLVVGSDYDVAREGEFRAALMSDIPDGHCFAYGRRYVTYTVLKGVVPPDFAIAASGCPQLNGSRWRGLLGDNNPEELSRRDAIAVRAGAPFRVVTYVPCRPPEPPAHLSAAVTGTSVSLSWDAVPRASSYQIEVGSHSGWSDLSLLADRPDRFFTAHHVAPRLYFTRVRATNACGNGGASPEIQVRVN